LGDFFWSLSPVGLRINAVDFIPVWVALPDVPVFPTLWNGILPAFQQISYEITIFNDHPTNDYDLGIDLSPGALISGTTFEYPPPPDIYFETFGGIDLGGITGFQFIGNPSGIYTLVNSKTNDTLIERIPTPSTQVVKIPDPFIKTGFLGK
jgi:hypothetical protein